MRLKSSLEDIAKNKLEKKYITHSFSFQTHIFLFLAIETNKKAKKQTKLNKYLIRGYISMVKYKNLQKMDRRYKICPKFSQTGHFNLILCQIYYFVLD